MKDAMPGVCCYCGDKKEETVFKYCKRNSGIHCHHFGFTVNPCTIGEKENERKD